MMERNAALLELRALVATYLEGSDDAPRAAELLNVLESDLNAVLELASFFRDDYGKKLPVIAAFRSWRSGAIPTTKFLSRLSEDDLAPVLRYEEVPPMRGLALLNNRRQGQS